MIILKRTNSDNKDFLALVLELDKDLSEKNNEMNDFFAQFNKTDLIKYVVIAFYNNIPVGCGAMKKIDSSCMEIKRMFVTSDSRRKGIAGAILNELENWAKELDYTKCILETGDKMLEALGFYKKRGYKIIKNYGPYENIESSICFEKEL